MPKRKKIAQDEEYKQESSSGKSQEAILDFPSSSSKYLNDIAASLPSWDDVEIPPPKQMKLEKTEFDDLFDSVTLSSEMGENKMETEEALASPVKRSTQQTPRPLRKKNRQRSHSLSGLSNPVTGFGFKRMSRVDLSLSEKPALKGLYKGRGQRELAFRAMNPHRSSSRRFPRHIHSPLAQPKASVNAATSFPEEKQRRKST